MKSRVAGNHYPFFLVLCGDLGEKLHYWFAEILLLLLVPEF